MSEEPERRRLRLSRGRAVLAVLGGGALLLVSALPAWATAPAMVTMDATAMAEVNGSDGVPVVPSAALVVLAAGLAIGLAGRIARVLASLAVALCGGLAAVSTFVFLRDPEPALRAADSEASSFVELTGPTGVTPWPVVALVIGILLTIAGVLLPLVMGAWPRVGQRYERHTQPAPSGPRRQIADWDALSRGEDPSEPEER